MYTKHDAGGWRDDSVLAALRGDLGSVPKSTSGSSEPPVTQVPGELSPSSSHCGYLHTPGAHADKQAYAHIKINLI